MRRPNGLPDTASGSSAANRPGIRPQNRAAISDPCCKLCLRVHDPQRDRFVGAVADPVVTEETADVAQVWQQDRLNRFNRFIQARHVESVIDRQEGVQAA